MKFYHKGMGGYDMRYISGHDKGGISPRALRPPTSSSDMYIAIAMFRNGTRNSTSRYQGGRDLKALECNASEKSISLSRPVAMLGNLQCKGGQESCLAFSKRESAFHLAEDGHFASSDNSIRVDDFVTSRLLGILEFGERKRSTNDLRPPAKASDGLAVTEPMQSSEQLRVINETQTQTDASRI